MSGLNLYGNTFLPVRRDAALVRGEDVLVTVMLAPQQSIAGFTLSLLVKAKAGDAAALVSKAATITDAALGTFTFTLAQGDTAVLGAGPYVYEVVRTDGGNRTVLATGQLDLLPGVSV